MKKIKLAIIGITLLANLVSAVSAIPAGDNVEYLPDGVNLGLGVIDPAVKLEVNGQVMITGTNPQEGFVLTSDSDGLATWSALPTISNVENADTASFADSVLSLRSPDGVIDPVLFIDANGNANFSSSSIKLNGSDFILGLNDGGDIGSKTEQRALVHENGDVLAINYQRDFEAGVSINNGAIQVDSNGNVAISNDLTIQGPLRAKRLVSSKSPLVEIDVAINQYRTVPANRCANGIRVDYVGTYKFNSSGALALYLQADGKNIDSIAMGPYLHSTRPVAYTKTMHGHAFVTDVESDHEFRVVKVASGNPLTGAGLSYNTVQEVAMDITCM